MHPRICSATCSLHAFPDRIAQRIRSDARRYQLANGRMAKLFDDSALYGEPWIVASELALRGAAMRWCCALRRSTRHACEREFPQRFVERRGPRVVGRRTRGCGACANAASTASCSTVARSGAPDPQLAARRARPMRCAPRTRRCRGPRAIAQWRERVRCLRAWMPELGLPDLSDEALLATLDLAQARLRRQDAAGRTVRRTNWPKR
jgi:ATP-dependent helicase HrpB